MKKINVVDLDNTLIPFDSFRLYAINKIKSGNIGIIKYSILRKLRLISAADYKRSVLLHTKLLDNTEEIDRIMVNILNSINQNVLKIIDEHSDNETINILCSASPDAYVKKVAKHLHWIGYGSYFNDKDFYHMWGENKLQFIETRYPSSEYIYNFAISDTNCDLELLMMFKKYKIVK